MTTNTTELVAGNVKEATQGMKSNDLWQVPVEELHLMEGFNVRVHDADYEAHIEYLTQSILANGYMRDKPMSGYIANVEGQSRILITDGHSRYEALKRAIERGAQISTIPVVTKPRGTTMEDLTVALVTANSGRPLTPFETGTVIKRLISFGWPEKQVAEKLGITMQYVSDLLTLQEAPKLVRDLVAKGEVSPTMAIATVKKHGNEAGKVLREAVETAKSLGKAKASAKHVKKDWKTECKKYGTDLYEALMWVKDDAGFAKLTADTQEVVNRIISMLPPEPEKKPESALDKEEKRKQAAAKKNAKAAVKKVKGSK